MRESAFGYGAEPQPGALPAGERKFKHFYLNPRSQLHGWFGLRLGEPKERLGIDGAFELNSTNFPSIR